MGGVIGHGAVTRRRSATVVAAVGVAANACAALAFVPLRNDLGIVPAVLCFGAFSAAATALGAISAGLITLMAGALLLDYLYFPPIHTLTVSTTGEWATLSTFVVFNILLCVAMEAFRRNLQRRREREAENNALRQSAARVLEAQDLDRALAAVVEELMTLGLTTGAAIDLLVADRWRRAAHVGAAPPGPEPSGPEAATLTIPLRRGTAVYGLLRVGSRPASPTVEASLLSAFAAQAALAVQRDLLQRAEVRTEVLLEQDRVRRDFLANVTHDLRSPITGIEVAASSLRSDSFELSAEDQRHHLDDIMEEAERLDELLTTLLDLGRLEAGDMPVDATRTDAAALAQSAADRARQRGIHVKVQARTTVDVSADPTLSARVIDNLVRNAATYGRGTPVELVAAGTTLAVVDHGPGIAAADRSRMFQRFYRGRRDQGEGIGLGLAIAKSLMEAQQGSLHYQDTPGGGATFVATFPPSPRSDRR